MMTNFKKYVALSALAVSMASLGAAELRAESPVFGMGNRTCTTVNCQAPVYNGRIAGFGANSNSSVIQFHVEPGACARFHVTNASADLEMVVVAPNGTFFRNDDGGGGVNPLVVIGDTSTQRGIYTMVLQHFAGTSIAGGYVLKASQYAAGNVNCAAPTTPAAPGRNPAFKPNTFGTTSAPMNGPSQD